MPANDFQLQQALNYLNGKTIQKAPPVQGVVDGKSVDAKDAAGKDAKGQAADPKASAPQTDKAPARK